jgi:preprotein translocase subunit YajC
MHPIFEAFLAQAADGQAPQQSVFGMFVPFLAIAAVFYFIFLRPQQKQQKQHQVFLQSLKKGDEVVTSGGVIGEVFAVEDRVVTLNVGGGNKLRVLKANVAGQWKEATAAAAAEKK